MTHSPNVDFLNKLMKLTGLATKSEFAKRCGQAPSHMGNYLNGKKSPGDKVLRSCLERLFEKDWEIYAIKEVAPIDKSDTPAEPGVYILYDSAGNVLYVGKAKNLRTEVKVALGKNVPGGMRFGPSMKKVAPKLSELSSYISMYKISNERVRHNVEALLIRVFINQTHNSNIGKFK